MRTIPKRFTQDPDWFQVEEVISEFLKPLLDLNDIDSTLSAEELKIELLARKKSYEALEGFVTSRGLSRSSQLKDNKENIFK